MTTKEELLTLLSPWNQEHLLAFWDDLSTESKEQLASQLKDIDWETLDGWIKELVLGDYHEFEVPSDITPASYYTLEPETEEQKAEYAKAYEKGCELLRQGKVAGFTVAGGQGTRLGYDGPKGTYPVSPVKNKTLFQMFAEQILRTQEKYGADIAWYIMTSPINDAATRAFFKENNYFGLKEENVKMFPQGTLPAVATDGKLLLGAKDSLALSPNGHGGSLLALKNSGSLADMAERGVEHLSYWQVDNPLVTCFDPLFIGLHAMQDSEISARSLTKTGPFEKLGNFCISNDKLTIIEYSDMPDALAKQTDADGKLTYRAGSPAIHVVKKAFIDKLTDKSSKVQLPIHRADKKVPFVNENGETVKPEEPNAVKMEMFIFDALPLAEKTLILEADREEQFGPVKNATGVDSAESCRELLMKKAARWLKAAGVAVETDADGNPVYKLELSAKSFVDCDDVINSNKKFELPAKGGEGYYE